jgi:hypothetical protein
MVKEAATAPFAAAAAASFADIPSAMAAATADFTASLAAVPAPMAALTWSSTSAAVMAAQGKEAAKKTAPAKRRQAKRKPMLFAFIVASFLS